MRYISKEELPELKPKKNMLYVFIAAVTFLVVILLVLLLLIRQSRHTETEYDEITNLVYQGEPYAIINNNVPYFSEDDKKSDSFEKYSDLDALGRCGVAFANVSLDVMPSEPRGEIGEIRPTGWHTVKYNDLIEGNYLYNRCHLIAYCLTGENANEKNLITGTRYLNTEGMLPFEIKVSEYITRTGNHVLYRVTPIFEGDNVLVKGVQIEAYSIEDEGKEICFNVFCFNVQPGISINYETGESNREGK